MSGPKVVRVVTREELLATCEQHLRSVEHAAALWRSRVAQLGQCDLATQAAMLKRIADLRGMLAVGRLDQLQDAVKHELAFLQSDLEEREAQAVARVAAELGLQRQRREHRRALLQMLRANGADAALALVRELEAAADAQLPAKLSEGYAWLTQAAAESHPALSTSAQALAAALKPDDPDDRQSLAQWQSDRSGATADPRLQRVAQHIAQLQILAGAALAAPFETRLDALERELDSARHNLLLDSLLLDLAHASRAQTLLRQRMDELSAQIAAATPLLDAADAEDLQRQARALQLQRDLARVQALSLRCAALSAAASATLAANARRAAVLQGLAGLGYEVREGMATAWADQGRLALRKHATPGYGLELGEHAASGRLQLRVVAFDVARDRQRDRDIEALWCGDFQQLHARMQQSGTALHIEQALAVGQVPLKEIALDASAGVHEALRERHR